MTIVGVDLLPYLVPLVTPLTTARGTLTRRVGCVVRLRTDDGRVALGDAAPHPHDGEKGLPRLCSALGEATRWLRGASVARADELIDAAVRLGGAVGMGIDLALHDLLARVRAVAVAELLGGVRCDVTASALLAGDDEVAAARVAAAAGYQTVKLKADADPRTLRARMEAIRAAAPTLALRVDPNGAWSADDACATIAALPPRALELLEQPLVADDLDGLAQVRSLARTRGIRIAADEAVTGPDAVRRIAERGAADVVVVKLVQVGGLRRALETVAAARSAGLGVVVTTGLDTGVATAAALHLAAVVEHGTASADRLAHGVATGALLATDVVTEPIVPAACMALPDAPGLGVTLDPRSSAWLREAA